MLIALAQINPTIGDVAGNEAKIIARIERAAREGAELIVFPELAVIGYPPKDLLLKSDVIDQCERAIGRIAERCGRIAAVVGYPARSEAAAGRDLYNAAAVCRGGRVAQRHVKSLLPTYDVFDETRYFEPGPRVNLHELDGVKLGISICEDLWNEEDPSRRRLYHDNPIDRLAGAGARILVNGSASPFARGKHAQRLERFAAAARRHGLPIVYVNQVGGNDELIFDGASCVLGPGGEVIAQAKDFEEDLLIADVPLLTPEAERAANPPRNNRKPEIRNRVETPRSGLASVYHALVLGLRDYCDKCGFTRIVVGLSGGIDSAVTAAVAVAAMGGGNVTGVAMPSRYSSAGSRSDAWRLAENLGMPLHSVPIEKPHDAMEALLGEHLGELGGIAAQNIQARLRGVILMGFSNQRGSLLVTTGNKSEIAVGYCTLYGDMAGGLAVLSDLPKTEVYALARWINSGACPLRRRLAGAPIPPDTITKPPSAELAPDQLDADNLPPYDRLDPIIERYVERNEPLAAIVEATGLDAALVRRVVAMIDRNEYKRKQMPPGLKVTGRAFGSGRRMPIAQRYDAGKGGA